MCKKPFIRTNLSLFPPKATLFHPPPPIRTTLNLLSTKNTAILLIFALILCCKAGASHRFKSLPAIPGEVAAFRKTGYLMIAGCFNNNHTSTGDLNRPRSPEVRKPLACFLVTFCTMQKVTTRSLSGELRGSANLEAARRNSSFAPQQLKPFSGSSEVLQTSKQRTKTTTSHNQLNLFGDLGRTKSMTKRPSLPGVCRLWRLFQLFDAKS